MPVDVVLRIREFVSRERNLFPNDDGHLFAVAAGHMIRYREFLEIIVTRQVRVSERFTTLMRAWLKSTQAGMQQLTPEQLELHAQKEPLILELHLEIETFYLFAKILLDKVARYLEYYFGPERGLSLDSHDDLAKCLAPYSERKGLQVSTDLRSLVDECKSRISDFRDYQISHEKSHRTNHATLFELEGTQTQMSIGKLYPKEGEIGTQSDKIPELVALVDRYLDAVLKLVVTNREKSCRTFKGQPPEKS